MTATTCSDYDVTAIQPARYNHRKVWLFKLWELDEGAWHFAGHHSAPRSTPKADAAELVRHALAAEEA